MRRLLRLFWVAVLVVVCCSAFVSSFAQQQFPPSLFSEMKWRLVGPFRGGRAITATGVPGQPGLYYFGAVGGGVWKSTDAGTTWEPIFDGEPIASIGAIVVARANSNVIYVGTGEADMREDITYGNGMYKSTDGGKTWTNIGLKDSQQIGRIIVDPANAEVVYVAALGHAFGPNAERGVYRSRDGGKTWEAVLHKGDDTGAIDLAMDPADSRVLYAAMWQTRRPPWNVYPPSNGPGSGLYKSTDGGSTWQHLTNGLPTEGLGRIGIAVAPSEHNRVYAIVDAKQGGLYRSDDAGATWKLADNEKRIWGRGWYFGAVEVDPKNPDVVYVSNTSLYKSTDGGKSFVSFKGAPGGDDYHSIWIAPEDAQRMIVSSDQGTIVTLNGGKTWSSWYNQPTAQIYHIATDHRFPYWLYGAQQDSGAITVPSRSDNASITERNWMPIPVGGESDMLAPDPANSNVVYGGRAERFEWSTLETQDISPSLAREGQFRATWTLPIAASKADPRKIYFSHQMLFKTIDGGKTWQQISPDLTRSNPEVPANLDPITAKYGLASPRKGVIYTISPSPLDANLVWVGTDDGTIHVTGDDGKSWRDVTPKELTAWSKVGIIEASHFDKNTAYAAIDRHRIEDMRPWIYRTRDGGRTWQVVARGIPEGAFVNAVREDTTRRGLLFAGTELGMYVSFDDGDNWQPLQMNLPIVSVRDMEVHDTDLVIATHGRGFWILDDVTPLRQIATNVTTADAYLFKPADAVRVRPGSDNGTPYPPEIPHGDNPPNGTFLNYFLKADEQTPVTLEILDSKGGVVRRFASDDKPTPVEEKTLDFPAHWVKPTPVLSAKAGLHRWVWDVRYPAAPGGRGRREGGVWAVPAQYSVRLTVNGKTYMQPLTVKMDPRVKTPTADLQAQFAASQQANAAVVQLNKAVTDATSIEKQIAALNASGNQAAGTALAEFTRKLKATAGEQETYGAPVIPASEDVTTLRYVLASTRRTLAALQSADAAPTPEQMEALQMNLRRARASFEQWQTFINTEVPHLNQALKQAGMNSVQFNAAPRQ